MANNAHVNKVIYGDRTLIDISDSSFDPTQLPIGSVAYNAAGARVTGSAIVYNVYRDTTENWNTKTTFIPERNDVCIYTDHGQIDDGYGNMVDVPGIKVGDGNAYLIDLPFVGADTRYQILTELRTHTGNAAIHVTPEQKAFWDNKLNCVVDNGTLILNRL